MLAMRPASPSNCQLPSSHAQNAALTRTINAGDAGDAEAQPTNQPTNQPTSLLAGVKPRAGASNKKTPVPFESVEENKNNSRQVS